MTHFVYVYCKQPAIWEEINYSVMSIRKFFKGDYKIFIYGDDPRIKGTHIIPTQRVVSMKYAKTVDINSKILKMANNPDINEDFVYLYDDIILLKPCTEEDFKPTRAIDYVKKPGQYFGPNPKPSQTWIEQFVKTMTILKREDLPTWNYETHLPRWYNKNEINQIFSKYKLSENSLLFASLYFNNFNIAPFESINANTSIKAGLYDPHETRWIEENVPGKLFMNYDNAGLNENLKKFIKKILA
jgi:hypothetical protein